jgi:hypothetical protein
MHNKELESIKQNLSEEMEQIKTKHAQEVSNLQTDKLNPKSLLSKTRPPNPRIGTGKGKS